MSVNDVGAAIVCALCAIGGFGVIIVPILYAGHRRRVRWYE